MCESPTIFAILNWNTMKGENANKRNSLTFEEKKKLVRCRRIIRLIGTIAQGTFGISGALLAITYCICSWFMIAPEWLVHFMAIDIAVAFVSITVWFISGHDLPEIGSGFNP